MVKNVGYDFEGGEHVVVAIIYMTRLLPSVCFDELTMELVSLVFHAHNG